MNSCKLSGCFFAPRPHPLARQIGVEQQERGDEDGRKDGEIDPVRGYRGRAGGYEQGQDRQHEENHRLNIG